MLTLSVLMCFCCQTHLSFDSLSCVWVFLNFLNLCHEIVVQDKNSWWGTTTINFLVLNIVNKIKKQIFYLLQFALFQKSRMFVISRNREDIATGSMTIDSYCMPSLFTLHLLVWFHSPVWALQHGFFRFLEALSVWWQSIKTETLKLVLNITQQYDVVRSRNTAAIMIPFQAELICLVVWGYHQYSWFLASSRLVGVAAVEVEEAVQWEALCPLDNFFFRLYDIFNSSISLDLSIFIYFTHFI